MNFALDELDTKTKAEVGVAMPLKKLDGSPMLGKDKKPITIIVHGTDSDAYRIASTRAIGQIKGEALSDEEIASRNTARRLDILVACTVGWTNITDKAGGDVKPTPDAIRALYDGFPVIADQVDRFVGDRANFLLASSKS